MSAAQRPAGESPARFLTPALAVAAVAVSILAWRGAAPPTPNSAPSPSSMAPPQPFALPDAPIAAPESVVAPSPAITSDPAGSSPAPTTHAASAPPFVDATAESGIAFVHDADAQGKFRIPEEMGPGGAFIDYDNDGDMDLYLVQGGPLPGGAPERRNVLYRNEGGGRFKDVSSGSGADIPGYGMGAAAADYDADGNADLYVTRVGSNVLLRNNGDGTFSDATAQAGVASSGFATAAAFFDYDRDGGLDLLVLNYLEWPTTFEGSCFVAGGILDYCGPSMYAPVANRLFHNEGGGRFRDVSESSGIAAHQGKGLGLACTDFDGDGWLDVYVANDQVPAFLFMNQRDGTFKENALLAGCAYAGDGRAIAGMGVDTADLDGDGDYDLLVTNIRGQSHLCLRNDGGLFEDIGHSLGFGTWSVPYTGFGVALLDIDHDGDLDGFFANGAVNRGREPLRTDNVYAEPNQIARRGEDGRFADLTAAAGPAVGALEMSRGALAGDYDNDGDLDLVVTNNRGPTQLLRNEQRGGHWLMLDLIATGGGRNALNARVEVSAGGRKLRREVRPHASYLCSHDPRVHFGLGAADRIDLIRVTWPDRSIEVWRDVRPDEHLTLRQGGSNRPSSRPAAVAESAP